MAVGVVAEIKGRLPVADVVGETVQLKKAGTTLKGLCPFHGEKTPSFVVTPARETWHCFGCGKHGDIFTFVMERDSVAFPEALKVLAARAGVELDERTKAEDARNARLRSVLESAIAFYHAVLLKSKSGEPALAYLRDRGFTDATIEKHQLGWAPGGWDTLVHQLGTKRQIVPQDLLEVGLASPRQRGGGVYDRFRERVIFPIRDANGHPVGLGGRILPKRSEGGGRVSEGHPPEDGDTGPKYLNSPATPLFDKSRTLYLIDRAKTAIRKTGQAVIVEGYTDALMAHQAGFENVVASLGTALTPGQVALITRYAKRIALAYDVDAAGEKAGTFGATALEELIRQLAADDSGVELDDVRVVSLPAGRDPDEVVREEPDRWREEVRVARPIVDHLLDVHARANDLKTAGGKARFAQAAIEVVRSLPPLLRDPYLQQISQESGISQGALMVAMREAPARRADTRFTASTVIASADALPVNDILRSVSPPEQTLLRLVLLVPEAHDRLLDGVGPDRVRSQVGRELFRAVARARARDEHGVRPPYALAVILDRLDDETRALGQAIIARSGFDFRDLPDRELNVAIEQTILDLEEDEWRERSDYNRDATSEAERDGDAVNVDRLLLERRLLNEQRRSLDKRRDQSRLLARPAVPAG